MKVLNFGSLNIDYTYSVDHFVEGGETLSSRRLQVFSGGKGLNQSIALSKSGAEVWHAGAVGQSEGEFLLEELEKAGVHTELVARLEEKTGHAIIQRDKEGGNCILLYGGANQQITPELVDHVMAQFEKGDWLVLQNEISQISYMMERAHEKGMKIVLNPSPMDEKIFTYPLEYIDYFLMNEIEGAQLCQGSETRPEELLARAAARFPGAGILLTLGGEGSLFFDHGQLFRQKAYRVKAVDTTAAGDTFTGFFIGGLIRGMKVEEALSLAGAAAAIAVSRPGAAPSIPELKEAEDFKNRVESELY